ncbi:MAG: magnesium/cobalt transporter CorA [Gemmatimonadota bacterium]|jgi:magnesium transporter
MASSERKRRSRGHTLVPDALNALNPVHRLRVMGRFVRRQSKKPGSAPGTLIHTGVRKVEEIRIRLFDYDEEDVHESFLDDIRDVWDLRDTPTTTWVNVDGLHEVGVIEAVGQHYGIHPLILEDILSVGQRPKMEEHEGYLFLVLPMLAWSAEAAAVEEEQLSLILGRGWVFTFQERPGDVFEPVRERIRTANSRLRTRGADYLAYALIDAVVDRYFGILEKIGEVTEELELEVLEDPSQPTMERLHRLKREILVVRRAVWPLRDVSNSLMRAESELVDPQTRVFLRDVHDHTLQVIDTVESLRDVVGGTIDLYLSQVGHRQNEIMKVLTVMASIFIPLTFLAGIYGMNFEHMPELVLPWAYPTLLGVMVLVALLMLLYFRRKGWL